MSSRPSFPLMADRCSITRGARARGISRSSTWTAARSSRSRRCRTRRAIRSGCRGTAPSCTTTSDQVTRSERGGMGQGGGRLPSCSFGEAQRGDVSADGRMLVFTAAKVPDQPGPIRVMPLSGGEPRALTQPGEEELESGAPIWSLDGKTVYCKVHDEAGQTSFWAISGVRRTASAGCAAYQSRPPIGEVRYDHRRQAALLSHRGPPERHLRCGADQIGADRSQKSSRASARDLASSLASGPIITADAELRCKIPR